MNNLNISFGAKLYPYPKTITNKKILEMFEKRTSNYPDWILSQDDISYFGNDHFLLFDSKHKVRAFDTAWFTKDMPKTEIDIVNRLVSIFNKLMKQVEK